MRLRRGYVLWSGTALAVAAFALSPAIGAVADLVSGSRDSQGVSLRDLGSIGSFTPANADPRLAASYAKARSEAHTSELQSLMRSSYAVSCLKKKITTAQQQNIKSTT